MKTHIDFDAESGGTHSLEISTAKLHDSQDWDALLHGNETSVWADKVNVSAERAAALSGLSQFCGIMREAPEGRRAAPH
tara:strand:+ start:5260 stop:5496 length:237 start_codon:yes stop_codon:yes gene_type:complete